MRFILFFICLSLFSCKKNTDDSDVPVINQFSISSENVDLTSSLTAYIQVTDNIQLSAIKLTVSPTFYFSDNASYVKSRFSYTYVEETAQKDVTLTIPIPLNDSIATGSYMIEAVAIDAKGNLADKDTLHFQITDLIHAPQINLSFPVENGTYNASDTLNFMGTITDNEAIQSIAIYSTQSDLWTNTLSFNYDTTILTNWDFQTNGNVSIVLPSSTGETQSNIYVLDTMGNQSSFTVNFTIN